MIELPSEPPSFDDLLAVSDLTRMQRHKNAGDRSSKGTKFESLSVWRG
jgi:hypothetical protein